MFIKNAEFIKSCASSSGWIDDGIFEVAFLGRSNVGKSTFINLFCNRKKLAKTSQTPGKTRLLNLFNINDGYFRLVDTPGYGYAKINNQEKDKFIDMMEDYLTKRKNLVLCCLLLDMRREPNSDDVELYKFLKFYKRKVLIIGTKQDKIKRNDIQKNIKLIKQKISFDEEDTFIQTSSMEKLNIDEVVEYIFKFIDNIK